MRSLILLFFCVLFFKIETHALLRDPDEVALSRYRPARKKEKGVRLLMPLTHYGSIDLGYSYEISVPLSFGSTGHLLGAEVAYEKGIGGKRYALGLLWLPSREFTRNYKQFSIRGTATQYGEKKDFYNRGGKTYVGAEIAFTTAVSIRTGYSRELHGDDGYFFFAIGAPCFLSHLLHEFANSSVH